MIRDAPRANHDGETMEVATDLDVVFFKDHVDFRMSLHHFDSNEILVVSVADPIKLAALRNRLSMWKNAKGYEKKDV